ncbi:hypothetical protein YC2023_050810 [Brassica napus]
MSKPVFHSGQSHSALGLRSGWCDCGDGLWLVCAVRRVSVSYTLWRLTDQKQFWNQLRFITQQPNTFLALQGNNDSTLPERSFQTGGDKSFQGMHRKVRSIGSGLQFFIYRVQCHD